MRNRKKLTALLLAAAMVICLIPSVVWADDNKAELTPVTEAYDEATLGASEGDDANGGISVMSLLPLDEVTGSVLLDRSDSMPSSGAFDRSFTVREVFDQLIEKGIVTDTDIYGKIILYAIDDDDYEEVRLDSVVKTGDLTDTNSYYYGQVWYDKVYFIIGDGDQFNIDNTRYVIDVNFKYYEQHTEHEVTIYRKEQTPEEIENNSVYTCYVKEALYGILSEEGRLNENGSFDGEILYHISRSSNYNSIYYTSAKWDSIINPINNILDPYMRSVYFYVNFIVAPDSKNPVAAQYVVKVNIEYAGSVFLNSISAEIYNGSNESVQIAGENVEHYGEIIHYIINGEKNVTNAYTKFFYVSVRDFGDSDKPSILLNLPDGYSMNDTTVYKGLFYDESKISGAENITSQIFRTSDVQSPYSLDFLVEYPDDYQGNKYCSLDLTFVITGPDGSKNIVPARLSICLGANQSFLYVNDYNGAKHNQVYFSGNSYTNYSITPEVKVYAIYYDYIDGDGLASYSTEKIDFACFGKYSSKEEAVAAGKTDIKDTLFTGYTKGTAVDLSACTELTAYLDKELTMPITLKQVWVTVVDTYGMTEQIDCLFDICEPDPYTGSSITMSGAMIDNGDSKKYLNSYSILSDDSYYMIDNYNGYQTLFILNNDGSPVADGTVIYPTFSNSTASTVNRADCNKTQVSGESSIMFKSGEAVQYTVGAENGINRSNYWVTYVTQQQGGAKLFVNGINNKDHWNKERNMPQREIIFKGLEKYHDIFIANIGDEELTGISVKLSSDTKGVKLDDYWTVIDDSKACLAPFTKTSSPDNIAKIRLVPDDDSIGEIISGTLTISSANGGSYDIDLTGIAGIPQIITSQGDIHDGVKYVPYSKVIMTNCMHGNNGIQFELNDEYFEGKVKLPEGVELLPNGLIYGVPKEAGTFLFRVKATYTPGFTSKFGRDTSYDLGMAYYTLTVADNTDENVDGVNSDSYGYELTDKVSKEITVYYKGTNMGDDPYSYMTEHMGENYIFNPEDVVYDSDLFRSVGEFSDFKAFYLDGEALSKDAGNYSAESGSTKITVNDQTFRSVIGSSKDTRHTLAAEFKQDGTYEIKRSAQNFTVKYVYNGEGSVVYPPIENIGANQGGSHGTPTVNIGSGANSTDTDNTANNKDTAGTVSVSMTIVDPSGNVIPGLALELHSEPQYASTDSNGSVSFDTVEFGKHTLYVTNPDTGKKVSLSFTIKQGKKTEIDGKVITAVPGEKVNMTVEYNGKSLAMSSSMADISAGAGISDGSIASETDGLNIVVFFTALLLPFIILARFAVRKKDNK